MPLFMTDAERKRERKRMRRRAVREIENAVDAARAKCEEIRRRRNEQWAAAKGALRAGNGDAARGFLATFSADGSALSMLEARLAGFEEIERKMNLADADAAFSEASALFARFMKEPVPDARPDDIAPEPVDELFDRLRAETDKESEEAAGRDRPGRAPAPAALKVEDEPDHAAMWTATKPDAASLDDVIGLDDAKAVVADALINPVKHPDIYKTLRLAPGTGLLLYGPPGTGKTLFAKAIANELDLPFMEIRCDNLKGKYVGETEKNVAGMFRAARSLGKCVLFLDECNAILARRGDQKIRMVEQFLVELDGFAATDAQIFVLMATNLPWTLDPAITRSGRLSKAVYVGLPDETARRRLIELALRDAPLAEDVDVAALAAETEGFSGADIAANGGFCHEAKTLAARRWIGRRESGADAEGPEKITLADLKAAIAATVPVSKSAADIIRRNMEFSLSK